MIETSLQNQTEKQKRKQKIFLILRIFLCFCMWGDLAWAISLLIISAVTKSNVTGLIVFFFIASFILAQWCTSYRILSFSSFQFMYKNKVLLLTYNILTLNILGIILAIKFLKNHNYNSFNLIQSTDFWHDNKMAFMLINILLIWFAFAFVWSYKYMKYLKDHEEEWMNVKRYNQTLYIWIVPQFI